MVGQNRYTNDINARFDELANQLAVQRMEALQRADDARNDAAVRTATAQADAAEYAPTAPPPAQQQPPVTQQPPVAPVLPPNAPVLPPQYVAGPPPEQGGGRGAMYNTPAPMQPDLAAAAAEEEEEKQKETKKNRPPLPHCCGPTSFSRTITAALPVSPPASLTA